MCLKLLKKINSLFILIGVTLWVVCGAFMMTASAEDAGKVTLLCKTTDGIIMDGMHWDIYKIGIRDNNDNYVLQEEFENYPVSLVDRSTSAMTDAAETLENYAEVDAIVPFASGDCDQYGELSFGNLEKGLYLLTGDFLQIGDIFYFPAAFIVEIHSEETTIDMTIHPKYIIKSGNDLVERHIVKKIWENDEIANRSSYINVKIYRDNSLYETIKLDESNNWTYEWSTDAVYQWNVIEEEVPKGYNVVYRSDEPQFVIVNTYSGYTDITEPTTNPTEPTVPTEPNIIVTTLTDTTEPTSDSSVSTTGTKTTSKVTVTTLKSEKLPQTGQLWWPVPLLALAGLILVAIGFRLRTKE